ncbi:hypothetical protein O181_060586 [Austropuccinia psidii MF-1]|uniref:Integrase catalytic domain-containing protein n=1 Tax=Austropuccinia psidii MF-1 TaxID=1389203 RepID=A0A9Q3HWR9_9BASI|nr:hypothetical protein [Austropuccinia psidii MF-1]
MIVQDVPFSTKISGTILSIRRLCRFLNDCWWIDVVSGEGTIGSAAETSSPHFFEMNPISLPKSTTLSLREWHERLGHACDKLSIARSAQKRKVHMDIPKKETLDLLVSDVLGPFEDDAQGFQYLLTLRDHVSTYSIVYPLKSRLDAPAAILDAIKQLQVRTGLTPKALRTDNTREFTSKSFANSIAVLGITFCPSLPYSPQENGKAERLNRTLADMARAMVVQSQMTSQFWQFAYASASYIHNQIPNSRCPKTSPHQELFGHAPSIATLYAHGADAVVHIPSVQQRGKLEPRAIDCKLLRPLLSGSWLLWDQRTNKMIQSTSVIFPQFQPSRQADTPAKGSLLHIMNAIRQNTQSSRPSIEWSKPRALEDSMFGRAGSDGEERRPECCGERAWHEDHRTSVGIQSENQYRRQYSEV